MAAPCCQSFQKWLSLMLYVSGIVLSSYAYYVEGSKSADENYVALCDINENVTCSKVFNSKYGKDSVVKGNMAREGWIDLGRDVAFEVTLRGPQKSGVTLFPDKVRGQDEFLMTLISKIKNDQLPWLNSVKDEKVEFLVILDKSGSMSGRPWSQVQRAADKIAQIVKKGQKVGLKFVTYDQNAQFSDEAKIQDMRSGGSTNFVAAFEKIKEHMEKLTGKNTPNSGFFGRPSSKAPTKTQNAKKLFVFFMTDGEDTCNSNVELMKAKEHLQTHMEKYGADVIVHVLGFSSSHNDVYLESLSLMGTADGSYSFIAETDGDEALEKRLCDLIEGATGLVGKSAYLELKFDEKSKHQFLGDWFDTSKHEIVLQTFIHAGPDYSTLETTKFVLLKSDVEKPEDMKINIILRQDLRTTSAQIQGTVKSLKKISGDAKPESKENIALELRKLRTSLKMITTKMFDVTQSSVDLKSVETNQRVLEPFFKAVSENHKKIRENVQHFGKTDKEIDQLAKAVESGIQVCGEIFEDHSQDVNYRSKKMRSAQASYLVGSKQMNNMKQVARKAKDGEFRQNRNKLQFMESTMD